MVETNETAAQVTRSREMRTRTVPRPRFEDFFRESFRELVKIAMYAGATYTEAEDAAAKTMAEMLPRYEAIRRPLSYARKAVVHNFVREKTRSPGRVARRLTECGQVPRQEGAVDRRLTAWEDEEWVTQLLNSLPPAQREVMACLLQGLSRDDMAKALGKSKDAIRQNLCDARKRLAAALHPKCEQEQSPGTMARSAREEDPCPPTAT